LPLDRIHITVVDAIDSSVIEAAADYGLVSSINDDERADRDVANDDNFHRVILFDSFYRLPAWAPSAPRLTKCGDPVFRFFFRLGESNVSRLFAQVRRQ